MKKIYPWLTLMLIAGMAFTSYGCAPAPTPEPAPVEPVAEAPEAEAPEAEEPVAEAECEEPVKIGWAAELTGPWGFLGTSITPAAEIAVEEINAAGGVLGCELLLIIEDNATDPATSVAVAKRLAEDENVLVLSAPTSSDTALAIRGYAEENGVPFVIPVAATPRLTEPGTQWSFRVEPDAVGWGYAYATFISELMPEAKVAVLYSDFAAQTSVAIGFQYTAENLTDLEITDFIKFPQATTDATVEIAQVMAKSPDWIITAGGGGFWVGLKHQLVDAGFPADRIIDWILPSNVIIQGGEKLVGSMGGTFFDAHFEYEEPYASRIANLVEKFQARKGVVPGYIESFGYNTIYLIKEIVELAGVVDREAFRDAARQIETVEYTTGVPIVFDENGARLEFLYILQVTGVSETDYTAQSLKYLEWEADVIPVYDLSP
jgi:branched-chain amino acid transport system substrate-binding protein